MSGRLGEDRTERDDAGWLRSARGIVEETRRRLSHVRGELQTLGFGLHAVTEHSEADDDDEALEILQVVWSDLSQLLLTLVPFPFVGVPRNLYDMRCSCLPTNTWVKREAWMRSSGGGCRNVPALREVLERLVPLQEQLVAKLDDLRDHESLRAWHDPYCWVGSKHGFDLYAIVEMMHGEAKVLLGELQTMRVALVLAARMGQQVAEDNDVTSAASPAPAQRPRAA